MKSVLALFLQKENMPQKGMSTPDPQKAVNVPRIQNSHLGCSSNISNANLTISEIKSINDRYK